jgi:hypothetical protein
MRSPSRLQFGVSLIEALVALAVMAFGMLGVVGVQSTLRMNSDISKQRSEAVRLAQQAIEDSRAFIDVAAPGTAGVPNYADLASSSPIIDSSHHYVANFETDPLDQTYYKDYETNAEYTLNISVFPSPTASAPTYPYDGSSSDPPMQTYRVNVAWKDRTNADQNVYVNTVIARIMPELSGTLALAAKVDVNGVPTSGGNGRNPNIPYHAADLGDGTSGYIPPGQASLTPEAFVFNNTTGLITELCTASVTSNDLLTLLTLSSCSAVTALPLSGTVDFAAAAASASEAVAPSGTPQTVQVAVTQTFPGAGVGAPECFTSSKAEADSDGVHFVSYICAVQISAVSSPALVWSGSSSVTGLGITWAAGGYSVCRYTAGPPAVASRSDLVVPAISNAQHPHIYSQVAAGLSAQNFLVVPYLTGTDADCPDGAPLPSGTTTYPQH